MAERILPPMPAALAAIQRESDAAGFTMASEPGTGALLAALAASKPGGRLLELGTGTGIGTAWLLSGMDAAARLETVDTDPAVVAIAQRHLSADPRVTFHLADAAALVGRLPRGAFDLIFADAWPGKFSHVEETLALLRAGGIYVIDDLLPQPNWPEGHAARIPPLVAALEARPGFTTLRLSWASGLMLAVRRRDAGQGDTRTWLDEAGQRGDVDGATSPPSRQTHGPHPRRRT